MTGFLKQMSTSLLHLAYPPLCLHCSQSVSEGNQLFCPACLELLVLIDSAERCPYCFSAEYCPEERLCTECLLRNPVLCGIASAFDYAGPAATLIRSMKYGNLPYLAKGAGAYAVAQFLRLDWPMPDCVIAVPMALSRRLDRGYNQVKLLGKSIATILDRPFYDALGRSSGDFSQAGLSRQQRMNLKATSFFMRENRDLAGRCILLVDDVMTTGSTLRACAQVLMEQSPSAIYGLTVCRTIR